MASLADEWLEQRQVCIDVLCAYLRIPYEPALDSPWQHDEESEVRLSITSVISDICAPARPSTGRATSSTWSGRSCAQRTSRTSR